MLKTCQTLLYKIQVLWVKKKKGGGWGEVIYWSPMALRAHPLHARTDTFHGEETLMSSPHAHLFLEPLLQTSPRHKGASWCTEIMYWNPSKDGGSLPCAWTRFPADKSGQRESLGAQECGNRCSIERRQWHTQGPERTRSFLEVIWENGNWIQGLTPPLAKLPVTSNTIDS